MGTLGRRWTCAAAQHEARTRTGRGCNPGPFSSAKAPKRGGPGRAAITGRYGDRALARRARSSGSARTVADMRSLRDRSLAIAFTVALALSTAHGTPAKLPGIALGWRLLLHVERAAAAAVVVGRRRRRPATALARAAPHQGADDAQVSELHKQALGTLRAQLGSDPFPDADQ
jgi:hypothetical protein